MPAHVLVKSMAVARTYPKAFSKFADQYRQKDKMFLKFYNNKVV